MRFFGLMTKKEYRELEGERNKWKNEALRKGMEASAARAALFEKKKELEETEKLLTEFKKKYADEIQKRYELAQTLLGEEYVPGIEIKPITEGE